MKRSLWPALAVLALWLALAGFTAGRHEMWRDEVRPLTLAREATSPLDLYRRTEYDGHPMLWFLLLYAGYALLGTKLVLPGLALAVAAAAVALFLLAAPIPLPLRALFVFGALPLYEYAVMARNYGIAMLLLFLAAVLYPPRAAHPWRLALVLALLANTNLHAAILACLLAGVWLWDAWRAGERRKPIVPLLLVGLGVAFSLLCALPRPSSNLTTIYGASPGRVIRASLEAAKLPDWTFFMLLPSEIPGAINRAILWIAVAGLAVRPVLALAAATSAVALGVLFRVGYFGSYRHQGLFLLFLLALYWIASVPLPEGWGRRLRAVGLYAGVVPLLVAQLARTPEVIRQDVEKPCSSSPALAAFLRGSAPYREAVLLPEPAWFLESLPYYAGNALYYPREHRYGKTVSWTHAQAPGLGLGELLASARAVARQTGKPALIALAWDLTAPAGERRGDYGQTFSWTSGEKEAFERETVLLATFDRATTDENYRLYALRP
ncbi:MAG TPA: hypothetical protein VFV75_07525 [Candidatus Polarisedimenticolaceae bacterium]|nr:hypothetical protein [Candidatus Polarisedimenticolaceae bacterium]